LRATTWGASPLEGEAQAIAKKLAVLAGAGGRPISRANANALAAEGDAGEGWWRNQWAGAAAAWSAVKQAITTL